MKNLKAVLKESKYSCDARTMLFRLKDTSTNYERNCQNLKHGQTDFWLIDEENLHPGQGQTVVLLVDDPSDKDFALVYAGVLTHHEFEHQAKKKGKRILHVEKTFGDSIGKTKRVGINKFVGKKFASAFMFPFRQETAPKRALPPKLGSRTLTKRGTADVSFEIAAREVTASPEHNKMTNRLIELLPDTEQGCTSNAMFDALLKNYDTRGNDLLVEVKSSAEISHIRMAIGQLYSYWHTAFGESRPHLAVLLPDKPDAEIVNLLQWLNIGVLWVGKNGLLTADIRLKNIATYKE